MFFKQLAHFYKTILRTRIVDYIQENLFQSFKFIAYLNLQPSFEFPCHVLLKAESKAQQQHKGVTEATDFTSSLGG